jgi:two-component sensor histidine kinase
MHGRIQEWSDDAAERFGYESTEVVGRGLHTLFRPSDATGFYSDLLSMGSSEERLAAPVDWTFYHKSDGRQNGHFLVQRQEESGLATNLLEEITVFTPSPFLLDDEDSAAEDESAPGASAEDSPEETSRPLALPKPTAEELSRERLLLGEAHHRVKNHLQIITSMLNLQMSTLHNDEARDALRSSQNRVRSIAALHQHLFQLATGETADFREFAAGLVGHLRECYQVTEDRVSLELSVPERAVPEEWLMPLALSLNEMVSNAFKHAFAGKREGCMRVQLTWDDRQGELTVVDDGAGLPAGFTHHDSSGLGLKILRVFAGQIGGEVKIHSAPGQGAVFQLTFPVSSHTESASSTPSPAEDTKEESS